VDIAGDRSDAERIKGVFDDVSASVMGSPLPVELSPVLA